MGRYDSRVLKYSGAKVSLGVSGERGCECASECEGGRKREKKVEEDKLCAVRGAARRAAPALNLVEEQTGIGTWDWEVV